MAEVLEITELDQTEQLRLAWESAFQQTPRPTFLHTLDWLQAYWSAHAQRERVRLLAIRCRDRFIGFVPLCVRSVDGVQCLSFPSVAEIGQTGPLGRDQAAIQMLAMKHIASTPRDWDAIDLSTAGFEMAQAHRTARAMRIAGMHPKTRVFAGNTILQFEHEASAEADAATTKSPQPEDESNRNNFEFSRIRVAAASRGDGDPHSEILQEAADAFAWREGGMPAWKFHADAAKRGMSDICLVRQQGKLVGFAYNYHYAGNLRNLQCATAPSPTENHVGRYLLSQMIRDGRQRGDRTLSATADTLALCGGIPSGTSARQEQVLRLQYAPLSSVKYHVAAMRNWASKIHHLPQFLLQSTPNQGDTLHQA